MGHSVSSVYPGFEFGFLLILSRIILEVILRRDGFNSILVEANLGREGGSCSSTLMVVEVKTVEHKPPKIICYMRR
jgi:hypothetical protein